jgi:hypothetical protein
LRSARLDMAIRSAMRSPIIENGPGATPPPPGGPPARRRFAFARRLLGPVLSPIANYARRYLQASVEHELHETRTRLNALSAEIQSVNMRLDQTHALLHMALKQNDASARRFQDIWRASRRAATSSGSTSPAFPACSARASTSWRSRRVR